jgi:hypothetical protein
MQQWSKKLNYDPFAEESSTPAVSRPETPVAEQPAAAAAPAAASSSGSRRKLGKIDVAASEAAWDAVAARTSVDGSEKSSGSSSSSSVPAGIKQVSGMHVHVNGKQHHAANANGNGSSSSKPSEPAAAAAAAPGKEEQQQQHWQPEDAKQYMFEQVTGHQHLQPPLEHSNQQQQQQQQQPVAPVVAAAADSKVASVAERLRAAGAIGGVHGVSVWLHVSELCSVARR